VTVAVLANDTDPDGDPLSVGAVSQPAHGTATANPDGTITYLPDPDFAGTDSFTYQACDPDGLCDTATVTITVSPASSPPPPPPSGGPPTGGPSTGAPPTEQLASTGTNALWPLATALALLLGSMGALLLPRRARRSSPSEDLLSRVRRFASAVTRRQKS
jgi:hypothetical protein